MKIKIFIALGLICLLGLTGCGMTELEKDNYCESDCLNNNWEFGEHIGYGFCNCYNKTICNTINNITECS